MSNLVGTVHKHYPDLVHAARSAATICAVRCISNNTQPTTLIFVGPPSSGKSMVLEWLTPQADIPDGPPDEDDDGGGVDDDPLVPFFHRSDKFTAASFVSQHGETKKKALHDVDLLPKIKDKTLITPELAPLFAGRREDFVERMSMLVRVLDGQGLVTDAGTHGSRGYAKPHNFQWLGATTPVSPEVLAAMSKLGPRILYYEIVEQKDDNDSLITLIEDSGDNERRKRLCRAAMIRYVLTLYREYPLGSLHTSRVTVPKVLQMQIVQWARAICGLRVGIRVSKEHADYDDYEDDTPLMELVDKPERPFRVLGNLNRMVRAATIAHGRSEAKEYDLAMIRHVALSSGHMSRGVAFNALLNNGGEITSLEMAAATGWSRPTCRRYMRELCVSTLGEMRPMEHGKPSHLKLAPYLRELLNAPHYEERTHAPNTESEAEVLRGGRDADAGGRSEDNVGSDEPAGQDQCDDGDGA